MSVVTGARPPKTNAAHVVLTSRTDHALKMTSGQLVIGGMPRAIDSTI
jgi:hypothetical protein